MVPAVHAVRDHSLYAPGVTPSQMPNRAQLRRKPVGEFVYCMFAMDTDSPPCMEPATETMPGFMPPYYLCLEHRRLVEAFIDMAT